MEQFLDLLERTAAGWRERHERERAGTPKVAAAAIRDEGTAQLSATGIAALESVGSAYSAISS